ncbi:MAG: CRTAC1 family protein, partial [Actinomycetota bacterium]
ADNKLQTLEDGVSSPSYLDIALARGVTATRPYAGGDILPSTAWHPEFDDVNNDGLIDLFVTKGNVEGQIDYAANDPNNLLLGLADGTFVERGAEAGIANDSRSRGAALVDLNLDGMLDLVVVNRRVQVEVRRNVGDGTASLPTVTGNWLALRVRQPAPNTQAVGAWVEVRFDGRVVSREITVGGGHASGDNGFIHVGLGKATRAEVRVTYPGQTAGAWQPVEAGAFYDVSRSAGAPIRVQPRD